MANFNNPNDYSWQTQNNSQSYSFNTSNAFADQPQTLGEQALLGISVYNINVNTSICLQ